MVNLLIVLSDNKLVDGKTLELLSNCSSNFLIKERRLTDIFDNPYKYLLETFINTLNDKEELEYYLKSKLSVKTKELPKAVIVPKIKELKIEPEKTVKKSKSKSRNRKYL